MIDAPLSRLNVVVLAAGFSSRLGRPKPLARVHGAGLLRRTVGVLSQVFPRDIIVVAPPRAAQLRSVLRGCRVRVLENADRAGGLSTSVMLALRRSPCSAATLFVPVDLPGLSAGDLSRLIAVWRGRPRQVVARALGDQASTPLILPRHLYPRARELSGDVGLRDLMRMLRPEYKRLVTMLSAVTDVDTPQDLADARRRFRGRCLR